MSSITLLPSHRQPFLARCAGAVLVSAGLLPYSADAGPASEQVLLFSYFPGNGEDGLHLAHSTDGLHWEALRGGASFLAPEVGEQQLMRDPCIARGPGGRFHMVWTTGWHERGIGYAHSADLVNWLEQRYLPVMAHEPEAQNCWAPELFYDEAGSRWLIFWATSIPGRFPDTKGEVDRLNHRMYYTVTTDFEEFSKPKVLYDHGFSVIDASIYRARGKYLMFLKDETPEPAEKNIRMAWAEQPEGPWPPPSAPITGDPWAAGPTAIQLAGPWFLYFVQSRRDRFGLRTSADLENWTDRTKELTTPGDMRHGTVFRVPRPTFLELKKE